MKRALILASLAVAFLIGLFSLVGYLDRQAEDERFAIQKAAQDRVTSALTLLDKGWLVCTQDGGDSTIFLNIDRASEMTRIVMGVPAIYDDGARAGDMIKDGNLATYQYTEYKPKLNEAEVQFTCVREFTEAKALSEGAIEVAKMLNSGWRQKTAGSNCGTMKIDAADEHTVKLEWEQWSGGKSADSNPFHLTCHSYTPVARASGAPSLKDAAARSAVRARGATLESCGANEAAFWGGEPERFAESCRDLPLDECVNDLAREYRNELGDKEAPVTLDQLAEWQSACGEALGDP